MTGKSVTNDAQGSNARAHLVPVRPQTREALAERALHAAMLPCLALIATGNSQHAASARAHLEALAEAASSATRAHAEDVARFLANERGSLLEPFSCSLTKAIWIGLAATLIVRGNFQDGLEDRSLVITDGMIDCDLQGEGGRHRRWSGVRVTRDGVEPYRIRDFRRMLATPAPPPPMVRLSFDLRQIGRQRIPSTECTLRIDRVNPNFLADLRCQPHHGKRDRAKQPLAHMHLIDGDIPPIVGRMLSEPKSSDGRAVFELNPTSLLRLAAIAGSKRFMIRIAEKSEGGYSGHDYVNEELVVGSFDEDGARAVWLPRDGWADYSADWMPAVAFVPPSEEPCAPGTARYLIDLLTDLKDFSPRESEAEESDAGLGQRYRSASESFLVALRRQVHRDAGFAASRKENPRST